MPDKKIVDDYYSGIGGSNPASFGGTGEKKKFKVKPKKIVAKKIVRKIKEETEKNDEKKLVKKEQEKKTTKTSVFKAAGHTKEVRGTKKIGAKKQTSYDFKVEPNIAQKKQGGSNMTFSKPQFKSKKVFGNDKQKREGNEIEKTKKPKLAPFSSKKTRGKVRDVVDDGIFTRSHKIAKKKKNDKKPEDFKQNLVERTGETVVVNDVLSLKELSEKIGVVLPRLIAEFMKNGMMVNINSKIDFESASIVAEIFQIKLKRDASAGMKVEDMLEGNLAELLKEDDDSHMQIRPPVVSIMGHVDHGKTSLLDYIRESKVADGEAGGITQSIGAYQVEQNGQKITFLDTPGHEAFMVMRARGAKSTDIAILVVAADEGVKPQTIESISHAKEAGIPVIVAINKMDKEGANPDHVKGQLSEHGLTPEDWGGDTPMVPVSAHTGFGVDDLLEIILLVAEMKELKANLDRAAVATVIESHLDTKLGPVATVLVNGGTMKFGDNIVCKHTYGKVKSMKDYTGKNVLSAVPGDPVLIVGLGGVVEGGDIIQSVASASVARRKSIEYQEIIRHQKEARSSSLDVLMNKIKAGNLKQLKIVVKADTNGSLEAIKGSLQKLSTPETSVVIIHEGVGNLTEGDILMCEGSEAILVGFNVDVLGTAKGVLESSGVEFIHSSIIYHITDRIEKIITGMLDPKEVEVTLGTPKVLQVFYTSKEFMVVGVRLKEDEILESGTQIRVIRGDKMVGKGKLDSLKLGIEDVKSIEGPVECGIKFVGDTKLEEKDVLEVYKIEIEK